MVVLECQVYNGILLTLAYFIYFEISNKQFASLLKYIWHIKCEYTQLLFIFYLKLLYNHLFFFTKNLMLFAEYLGCQMDREFIT